MNINILILIIALTTLVSISGFRNPDFLYRNLFIPFYVREYGEKYRLFSHLFIHADYTHLLFNMFSLYFLGDIMLTSMGGFYMDNSDSIRTIAPGWMEYYGFWRGQILFLLLYFLGGLSACIIPYYRHKMNSSYRSLGASGAVSAVIFASIIWNPSLKLYLFFIPIGIPAVLFGPLYIAYEIYMDRRGGSQIAHDAHLGGALFGILFVLLLNRDAGVRFLEQISLLF